MELEKIIFNLIKKASTQLPDDTERALRKAYEQETNQIAKLQLKTILDNIEMARRKQLPICQDTGTLMFFVDVGVDFPYKREIRNSIYKAVEIATNAIPLRPNCVDPFTDKNTGNLGEKIPWIEWNVVEGK
ncbi:MAG: fumarate hydratase, partial [Thermoplasmata archaeon]